MRIFKKATALFLVCLFLGAISFVYAKPYYKPYFPTSRLDYIPTDAETFDEERELVITINGSVTIRKGPSKDYGALGYAHLGDLFTAYAVSDSWYLVEYKDGKTGWVSGKYAFALWMFEDESNEHLNGLTEPFEELDEPKIRYVVDAPANIRVAPDKESELIDTAPDRAQVVSVAQEGKWVLCNYKGVSGWIAESNFSKGPATTVKDGTWMISVSDSVTVKKVDGFWCLNCTIHKYVLFTKSEMNKISKGQTIKKNGFSLNQQMLDDNEYYTEWSAKDKGYLIRGDNDLPVTYADGTATLVLSGSARISDDFFAFMEEDEFTEKEKTTYGIVDGEAAFKGGTKLRDYIKLLKTKSSGFAGFDGSCTVKKGLVTALVMEYRP